MRFRRFLTAVLATVVAGVAAVVALPSPAAADGPYYIQLLWIRCQDTTGEPFSDEIWVDVDGTPAGFFEDFDVRETKFFTESGALHPIQEMRGDTVLVSVWERDQSPNLPGDWDFQGVFSVDRNLANTGEHEGYAFSDGQYIVRYRVFT